MEISNELAEGETRIASSCALRKIEERVGGGLPA
jgi:hypothetical protein